MKETMMNIIEAAKRFGFSEAAKLDCTTIDLKSEVRDMCAHNTCGQYAKNWACPPGCGSLEECEKELRDFKEGIIVQTVGTMEDSMDFEAMVETEKKYSNSFKKLSKYLQKNYKKVLPLGAGHCTICEKCTYPDEPCRFPEVKISSMEAYGMLVNEVCKRNNIKYYYGKNTICYVGCYLISD